MNRRSLLQLAAGGGLSALVTRNELAARETAERATRGMPSPII